MTAAALEIVVAPDAFKGSATAVDAAAAIAAGWRRVRPGDRLRLLPQADGGEGTLAVVEQAVPGGRRRSAGTVTGPDGRGVDGVWLELPDGTAVVELALVSGLPLMRRPDAIGATSRGLGEVLAAAIDAGCERLLIGLGGSASTDGGAPALDALGARTPPPGGAALLVDVDVPLLGPDGAARMFGPQKGADAAAVETLERRLADFAATRGTDPAIPGVGAAGGTAYGLHSWGAELRPGAAAIARLTGLDRAARTADLLVTGEGRFDAQSMRGKVVGHALTLGPPVGIVAGSFGIDPPGIGVALADLAGGVPAALADPQRWLEQAGAALATAAVRAR